MKLNVIFHENESIMKTSLKNDSKIRTLKTAPDLSTVGYVGEIVQVKDGTAYQCTAINEGVYTWEKIVKYDDLLIVNGVGDYALQSILSTTPYHNPKTNQAEIGGITYTEVDNPDMFNPSSDKFDSRVVNLGKMNPRDGSIGKNSTTLGKGNTNKSNNGFNSGVRNYSDGDENTTFGHGNYNSGFISLVAGANNYLKDGSNSNILGIRNSVVGMTGSTVLGHDNILKSGTYNVVIGRNLKLNNKSYMSVLGQFNIEPSDNGVSFIFANGINDYNRHNVLTLPSYGDIANIYAILEAGLKISGKLIVEKGSIFNELANFNYGTPTDPDNDPSVYFKSINVRGGIRSANINTTAVVADSIKTPSVKVGWQEIFAYNNNKGTVSGKNIANISLSGEPTEDNHVTTKKFVLDNSTKLHKHYINFTNGMWGKAICYSTRANAFTSKEQFISGDDLIKFDPTYLLSLDGWVNDCNIVSIVRDVVDNTVFLIYRNGNLISISDFEFTDTVIE